MLPVTSCWVPCDGLASHRGGCGNAPSQLHAGYPVMDWHPIQGGVAMFLVASCYRNRAKLRPCGPLKLVLRLYLYLTSQASTRLSTVITVTICKLRGNMIRVPTKISPASRVDFPRANVYPRLRKKGELSLLIDMMSKDLENTPEGI